MNNPYILQFMAFPLNVIFAVAWLTALFYLYRKERERAAVRLLIYLMKIRFGMAVIKTSWLSPAVALHGGNRSEAVLYVGVSRVAPIKGAFF